VPSLWIQTQWFWLTRPVLVCGNSQTSFFRFYIHICFSIAFETKLNWKCWKVMYGMSLIVVMTSAKIAKYVDQQRCWLTIGQHLNDIFMYTFFIFIITSGHQIKINIARPKNCNKVKGQHTGDHTIIVSLTIYCRFDSNANSTSTEYSRETYCLAAFCLYILQH
jgi:hypothetical protein